MRGKPSQDLLNPQAKSTGNGEMGDKVSRNEQRNGNRQERVRKVLSAIYRVILAEGHRKLKILNEKSFVYLELCLWGSPFGIPCWTYFSVACRGGSRPQARRSSSSSAVFSQASIRAKPPSSFVVTFSGPGIGHGGNNKQYGLGPITAASTEFRNTGKHNMRPQSDDPGPSLLGAKTTAANRIATE